MLLHFKGKAGQLKNNNLRVFWFKNNSGVTLERLNEQEWLSFGYDLGRPFIDVELYCTIDFKKGAIDLFCHGSFNIVSERFKVLLENCAGEHVFFKKINVTNSNMQYYLVNISTKCDCINFEKSNLKLFKGQVMRVERLELNYDIIDDLPIFYLEKSFAPIICAGKELVKQIELNNLIVPTISVDDYWL